MSGKLTTNDKKLKIVKYVGMGLSVAILALLVFKFTFIVWYLIIAAVISSIGAPIVNFLKKWKIGKKKYVPSWLAAALALTFMVCVAVAMLFLLVPLVVRQAEVIASINVREVVGALSEPIQKLTDVLTRLKLISPEENLMKLVETKLLSFLSFSALASVATKVFSSLGGFFISLVSILFISFFLMKEEKLFERIVMVFVNKDSRDKALQAIDHIKKFISRYFTGLLAEVFGMFVLESIGLYAIGVKSALPLALMGALFNLIPYVGPVIGTLLAMIIGSLSMLSAGLYDQVLMRVVLIAAVFIVSNWVDNFFLQPYIYSRSMQAHPLEIFIVILIFGSFAGVLGMFLAIPGYTVIKVIAKEFMSQYEIIGEWTQSMKME